MPTLEWFVPKISEHQGGAEGCHPPTKVKPSRGAYFLGMPPHSRALPKVKSTWRIFFLIFFNFFLIPLMPSNARAGYQPGYQKIIKVKIQWVFLFPKHYVLWLGEIPLHNVPSRYTQK
jgi:hypothetical protein